MDLLLYISPGTSSEWGRAMAAIACKAGSWEGDGCASLGVDLGSSHTTSYLHYRGGIVEPPRLPAAV